MLDLLSEYLNVAATPEDKVVIGNAMEVLEQIGHEDIEYVIEELLNTDDEVDAGATLQSIQDLVMSHLHLVMRLNGVTMDQSTNMRMMTAAVRGVMDLNDHEDRKSLIDVTDDRAPVREVYCELLAMVTQYPVDEWMVLVEEVQDGIINRLRELEDSDAIEDDGELDVRRERIHAFRQYDIYLTPFGGAPKLLSNMLRSGLDVALPFILYAKSIPIQLEQLKPAEIARELFGMAIVSNDGYTNPYDTIKSNIEEFVSSPDVITRTMIEVRNLQTGSQL